MQKWGEAIYVIVHEHCEERDKIIQATSNFIFTEQFKIWKYLR